MTEDLFVDPAVTAAPLRRHQEIVLRAVLRMDGVSADEAGQIVHAEEGKHSADDLCEWCGYAGAKVLGTLETAGLVAHRGGHWSAT